MTDSPHDRSASTTLSDGSVLELRLCVGEHTRMSLDLQPVLERAREELERILSPQSKTPSSRAPGPHGLIGESAPMQQIFRLIDKVAPTGCTVLITGENGTGKELVAQAIHRASPRANRPFVAANCSAFNDNLLESELFGHRRGSFTGASTDKRGLFEEADGGTFLLDEVGDMTPALQVKLLRVLQEGTFLPVGGTQTKKVDVRIIAATNKDLSAMVKAGTFREDLYYRLHVVALRTPALRDRGDDLSILIDYFMQRLSARQHEHKKLAPETLQRLKTHRWPGNVRELQNEIERLWVLSGPDKEIGPEHLSRAIFASAVLPQIKGPEQPSSEQPEHNPQAVVDGEGLASAMERFERSVIERALLRSNQNRSHAAIALGISRRNLIRKLQTLGLSGQDDPEVAD